MGGDYSGSCTMAGFASAQNYTRANSNFYTSPNRDRSGNVCEEDYIKGLSRNVLRKIMKTELWYLKMERTAFVKMDMNSFQKTTAFLDGRNIKCGGNVNT